MAEVYAGSDGSLRTGYQMWNVLNHESETTVLYYEDILVTKRPDEEGDPYVWYVEMDKEALPEGVEYEGWSLRDERADDWSAEGSRHDVRDDG